MQVRPRKAPPERASPTPGSATRTDLGADGRTYISGDQRLTRKPEPPLVPPNPSRASAATTGAGASAPEAAAPEGTGLLMGLRRQGKGWGR